MDSSFTSAVLKTSTPLSTVLLSELKVSVKGWAEEVDKSQVIRNKVNKLWITEELKLRVDALFHEERQINGLIIFHTLSLSSFTSLQY